MKPAIKVNLSVFFTRDLVALPNKGVTEVAVALRGCGTESLLLPS